MRRKCTPNHKTPTTFRPDTNKNGIHENTTVDERKRKVSSSSEIETKPAFIESAIICKEKYGFSLLAVMISLMTYAVRVLYVTDRNNWITVHPDEVFQSIEVAHIEYHGYGFRAYEFSSHFDDVKNENITRYRHMELEAGLSAIRSPVYPYFYVLVAKMASLLRFNDNLYVIFRLSHVMMTSLLPLCVYFYVSELSRSKYTGILAAILTASSIHLNVLGTHCFVHSFLSPFIFSAMSLVVSITNENPPEDVLLRHTNNTQSEIHKDANNNCSDDKNQIIKSKNKTTNRPYQIYSNTNKGHFSVIFDFSGFNQRAAEIIPTLFTETYLPSDLFKTLLAGFLIGITSYIRPDAFLIHSINFLIVLTSAKRPNWIILSRGPIICLGIMVAIVIGVYLDTAFYGGFTISPLNWFVLNVIRNISSSVFGKMSFHFYVLTFLSGDSLLGGVCVLSVICYTCMGMYSLHRRIIQRQEENQENKLFSMSTCFLLAFNGLLFLYSYHGHKEIRFIHDVIIIVFIFVALTITQAISFLKAVTTGFRIKSLLFVIMVVISVFQWSKFLDHTSSKQWAFQRANDTQNANACLEYVSKQPDVRGVFIESNLFLTGGMTLLHKDIPVFSRVMNGFFEFDFDARINTSAPGLSSLLSKSRTHKSVNTFTRVSNYVSQTNTPGALRAILEKQCYNYLVLTHDLPFLKVGFQLVFQFGNGKVLKRDGDPNLELRISQVLNRLPLGIDATVLIHEGDVLFSMKRYEQAISRFQHALTLDVTESRSDAVKAYSPLYQSLMKLGRKQEAIKIMTRCADLYGKEKCWTPREMTRLD